MIKAFIDTNVLIDLLLERDGCQDAATILLCQKEQKCSLFLSSLTMANIAYILRKKHWFCMKRTPKKAKNSKIEHLV